jgi:hypothetical protein
MSLSAALLAAPNPTEAQPRQTGERPDIEICQDEVDANQPVEDAVQKGMQRTQGFLTKNGFDLEHVNGGDCVDINAETVYDELDDIMPGRTGFDAHDYAPRHDTTGVAMANEYTASIGNAYDAARDSLETLPETVAEEPRRDLNVLSKANSIASSDHNSVSLSPYLLWTQSTRKARNAGIPRDDQDAFITAEISKYVTHELLHTYGHPHPWDWKTPDYPSDDQTSNVMGYGRPVKQSYEGSKADSVYAYTMSDVQRSLLRDAVNPDTEYHALQDTTGLEENYDAFADHWEEAYPDATQHDYTGIPIRNEDTRNTADTRRGENQ